MSIVQKNHFERGEELSPTSTEGHQPEEPVVAPVQEKHAWDRLNTMQLGRYAEYFVKMEFVLRGCDVFTSEVDDHGIDFVVRTGVGDHYGVQVKSFRHGPGKPGSYLYIQKRKFRIHPTLLLALVEFVPGEPPALHLLHSMVGGKPHPLLEDRPYGEGRKSEPEWGLTLSKRKLASLAMGCSFHAVVESLMVHLR